jgi:alkylhydroperoxidase family enzyme
MPRIPTIEFETATPAEQVLLEQLTARYGRATNMKRTLAHSQTGLDALMTWYPLHDAVLPLLGERLTSLFCYAISFQTDCLICSTYFRRVLIDAGEDPQQFTLDDREQTVIDFGRQLAVDANGVDDDLYQRLAGYFTNEQIVTLTSFGAMMIATNIVNNALQVDLDGYLVPYRATGASNE